MADATEMQAVQCGEARVVVLRAGYDNYVYLVEGETGCAVVDPSEAGPVLEVCRGRRKAPDTILVTHHHADHVAGLPAIRSAGTCRAVGPASGSGAALDRIVANGDRIEAGGVQFEVIATPGHTLAHVSYYAAGPGILFSGDTLFVSGCGRILRGRAEAMHGSLLRLAALPGETSVFCGHNYTCENLEFALAVEPDNDAARRKLEWARTCDRTGVATVPSTIAGERAANPFLRAGNQAIRRSLGLEDAADLDVFAELRRRKDRF